MSDFDEAYEQTVARVLSEHVERGVPDGTDLWPTVQKRLGEREGAVEQPREHRWFDWLLGVASPQDQTHTAVSKSPRWAYRYAQLVAGLVGLLLLAAITTLVISRLAARPDKNPVISNATVLPNPRPGGDRTLLFTVPISQDDLHTIGWQGSRWSGLAVAKDGSFWVGNGANRLYHCGPSGALLKIIDLPIKDATVTDLDAWGDYLWGYSEAGKIYELTQDGNVLAEYLVPRNVPGDAKNEPIDNGLVGLRMGGDGEVLLEKNLGTPYVRIVDAGGNSAPKALAGYPAGGKIYKIDNPYPLYVMAGDTPVAVNISGTVTSLHMLRVQPDGSFYILAEDARDGGRDYNRASGYTVPQYIMHYSSDGKLIERAQVPLSGPYDEIETIYLASGPDGSFYALTYLFDGGNMQTTRLDVYKINFYPAEEPLPPTAVPTYVAPVPPATDTPEPTAIADLATLVQRADVIVRVKLKPGGSAPQHTLTYDLEPTEWLKPATGVVTGNLQLQVFLGYNGEVPFPDTFKDRSIDDYILFLNARYFAPLKQSVYELVDANAGVSGVFAIRDGKIAYPGIHKYKGVPVEKLEDDIRALLTPTAGNKDLPPISLAPEGEGLRLQAPGGFGPVDWLNSSSLLVQLAGPAPSPQAGSGQALTTGVYLLDLSYARTPRPVALGASAFLPREVFPDSIGYYAALVGHDPATDRPLDLSVLDVRTGEAQTVYSSNLASPQWVSASQRAAFANISRVVVTWVGQDTFVATLMPIDETGAEGDTLQNLGKVVLVDIGKRSVQVLSERGLAAAAFGDGSILVQNGWIDGEVQLFAPPYTDKPRTIAPKGPWRVGWGWEVVAGGVQAEVVAKAAWLEMAPPPGDWPKRLPHVCCSGDPTPKVQAIVVWDRPTGQIKRFPVSNYSWSHPDVGWSQGEKLRWSIDLNLRYLSDPSLIYTAHPGANDPSTSLYRLGMDGKSTLLAKQQPYGAIKVVAEGNGGLYYEVTGYQGQNMVQLMRLLRDGQPLVERANALPGEWVIDQDERLLSRLDAGVSVQDLKTGETWNIAVPGEPLTSDYLRDAAIDGLITLSPGTGSWAIYRNPHESENGPVQVVHIIKSR